MRRADDFLIQCIEHQAWITNANSIEWPGCCSAVAYNNKTQLCFFGEFYSTIKVPKPACAGPYVYSQNSSICCQGVLHSSGVWNVALLSLMTRTQSAASVWSNQRLELLSPSAVNHLSTMLSHRCVAKESRKIFWICSTSMMWIECLRCKFINLLLWYSEPNCWSEWAELLRDQRHWRQYISLLWKCGAPNWHFSKSVLLWLSSIRCQFLDMLSTGSRHWPSTVQCTLYSIAAWAQLLWPLCVRCELVNLLQRCDSANRLSGWAQLLWTCGLRLTVSIVLQWCSLF